MLSADAYYGLLERVFMFEILWYIQCENYMLNKYMHNIAKACFEYGFIILNKKQNFLLFGFTHCHAE